MIYLKHSLNLILYFGEINGKERWCLWLKNISPASLKLNLTVVSETLLLLVVSLAVMMYFSLHAIKQEAMQDAEQTLAGTVQNIDNLLLSIEQTSDNVYH